MTVSILHPPLPIGLRKELPDFGTPWAINERLFQQMQNQQSMLYKKVQVLPIDPEWRFVWRYFHHNKPVRYGIRRIYCVHERNQKQAFELYLSSIEHEAGQFKANWYEEPRLDQRKVAMERWQQSAQLFSPFQTIESDGQLKSWERVKILPLWHGSSQEICHSISEWGFIHCGKSSFVDRQANGSVNRKCDFGVGIYFTNSARYAADIYSQGHLLARWGFKSNGSNGLT